MEQHFDFYHTKKPKKYVCNEHNKCYVYKKSYDEHLHRDHSDGNYRFMCDYCGKGFFHKSEFSIHRDSVHLKRKDYACNKCQQRAFTSIGHLNAHLAICCKEAKEQCGICGKMYSTKETLFTHINDVHKEGVTRPCPFCDEKVYASEGRYYKHMRVKHKISRNRIKLSDYMKAQGTEDKNSEEDENEEKDDSDGDKKKNQNTSRKKKKEKMMNQKILNTVQRQKTAEGGQMLDQKILITCSPSVRKESQKELMMGKSLKILKMTKREIILRTENLKEIQQKYRNL